MKSLLSIANALAYFIVLVTLHPPKRFSDIVTITAVIAMISLCAIVALTALDI